MFHANRLQVLKNTFADEIEILPERLELKADTGTRIGMLLAGVRKKSDHGYFRRTARNVSMPSVPIRPIHNGTIPKPRVMILGRNHVPVPLGHMIRKPAGSK